MENNIKKFPKNQSGHRVIVGNFLAQEHPSTLRAIESMYIYTDITSEVRVGEFMLRLLRILNIDSKGIKLEGASRRAFDFVYYSDLKFKSFETINMKLCDRKCIFLNLLVEKLWQQFIY